VSPTKLRIPGGAKSGDSARATDGGDQEYILTGPGPTPEAHSAPRGYEWKKFADKIKARDDYRCVRCHRRPEDLSTLWACHAFAWTDSPQLQFDERFVFSLCAYCDPDRNHELVFRFYPWLRRLVRMPGAEDKPAMAELFGSPCHPLASMSRVRWMFMGQGLLVWWFIVLPIWLGWFVVWNGPPLLTWAATMIPATVAGIYLSRYAHRTHLPTRGLHYLWRTLRRAKAPVR
jgi:hypothetical protein